MRAATQTSMIAIEKVLKAAVTIAVICAVGSPAARWFAFIFLGPVWITFKRLFCLKLQPLCVQFFVSMFFISCSFMVRHVYYCVNVDGDLISREVLALVPIFVYYYFVYSDRTAFHSIFAPGTDLLLTHVVSGMNGAYIVHSNVELDDRQLARLLSQFGSPDWFWPRCHDPLMLWAIQFIAQKDGTCESWISEEVIPRVGEPVEFTYNDLDMVLSERTLAYVAICVTLVMFMEELTFKAFAFFVLACVLFVLPRYVDALVDGLIHKACVTIPVVCKHLLSWTGCVARGARECIMVVWTWTSWVAPKVLRWCAYAAMAFAAIALGVCAGAAMYVASFALVMYPVIFAVRAVEVWHNLDEPSRTCFCRAALFMTLQRLACVPAVRCGVVAAVSYGVGLLQALVGTFKSTIRWIMSFVAAFAIALVVGAILAAALPARALVLSVNAAARGLVAGVRAARRVETIADQFSYPRGNFGVVECKGREDGAKAAEGATAVEKTDFKPKRPFAKRLATPAEGTSSSTKLHPASQPLRRSHRLLTKH